MEKGMLLMYVQYSSRKHSNMDCKAKSTAEILSNDLPDSIFIDDGFIILLTQHTVVRACGDIKTKPSN